MKKKWILWLLVLALAAQLLPAPFASAAPAPDAPPANTSAVAVRAPQEVPTEEEAYGRMIALKESYPEGMEWTNANGYAWHGGIFSMGFGCVGFAFILSDAAFGTLPARQITDINYDALRVGDILRVNNDSHSVVILERYEDHVVLAEGNYNNSIHWGRKLSREAAENATYYLTRYPEEAVHTHNEHKDATCTEYGYDRTVSDDSGEVLAETVIAPLGHDWNDGEITTPATETTAGLITYTCRRCGETMTEAIAPTGPFLPGDVDGSGEVDAIDSIRMAKYLVDLIDLTAAQKIAADVDGDGDVAATDAIRLAKYLVGLIDSLDQEPTEPTEAPSEPTEEPSEPTEAPPEPTEAPSEPTEAPPEPTEAPTEPTTEPTERPADALPDFTVQTITGEKYSLYEELETHDLVLINLFATWCGPCRMEFPYLQEAWEQSKDRVSVIAISVETTDTDAKLTTFANGLGLTFPIGREAGTGLNAYETGYIPTTLLVDRSGRVVATEIGAKSSTKAFLNLFAKYLP